jgi:hypothetical protein
MKSGMVGPLLEAYSRAFVSLLISAATFAVTRMIQRGEHFGHGHERL